MRWSPVHAPAAAWFERNTYYDAGLSIEHTAELKARSGLTVGVCLPALDEAETIGAICTTIRRELMARGIVDELVVIDSGSSDDTPEIARGAGAEVRAATTILSHVSSAPGGGKGESLWKSLAVLTSDLVVWLDSDTKNFTPRFVSALIEPLLQQPDVVFSKAFYDRPLQEQGRTVPGGARATEIGIRPLINLTWPELSGFIQPLSGEYAGRRTALSEIGFCTGYDVDLALVVDVVERFGPDAVVQVDLGTRLHRNRDITALGRMSFEIQRTLLERLEESGRIKLAGELSRDLVQFDPASSPRRARVFTTTSVRRPPMRDVLED